MLGTVATPVNPAAWEVELGGSEVQDYLGLYDKSVASLRYMRPLSRIKQNLCLAFYFPFASTANFYILNDPVKRHR